MISAKNIEQLQIFRRRSDEVNKTVIKDLVPRLQKNMTPLVGRVPSKSFFYRQAKEFDCYERTNNVAKLFYIVGAVYFTQRASGEKLIQFIESFFAWLRATAEDKQAVASDFWDFSVTVSQLNSERTKAFGVGNKQLARELSVKIARVETEAPMYLKGAVIKRRKNRKAKVQAA